VVSPTTRAKPHATGKSASVPWMGRGRMLGPGTRSTRALRPHHTTNATRAPHHHYVLAPHLADPLRRTPPQPPPPVTAQDQILAFRGFAFRLDFHARHGDRLASLHVSTDFEQQQEQEQEHGCASSSRGRRRRRNGSDERRNSSKVRRSKNVREVALSGAARKNAAALVGWRDAGRWLLRRRSPSRFVAPTCVRGRWQRRKHGAQLHGDRAGGSGRRQSVGEYQGGEFVSNILLPSSPLLPPSFRQRASFSLSLSVSLPPAPVIRLLALSRSRCSRCVSSAAPARSGAPPTVCARAIPLALPLLARLALPLSLPRSCRRHCRHDDAHYAGMPVATTRRKSKVSLYLPSYLLWRARTLSLSLSPFPLSPCRPFWTQRFLR